MQWMQSQELVAYCRYLEERTRQLEVRLGQTEAIVAQLLEAQASRKTSEAQPPCPPVVHIDSIQYKVQELVVQDLSGSLQIGLSALTDPEQLEKWLASGAGAGIGPGVGAGASSAAGTSASVGAGASAAGAGSGVGAQNGAPALAAEHLAGSAGVREQP